MLSKHKNEASIKDSYNILISRFFSMAVGIFCVRNCINLVLSVDPMKPKLRKILCGKIFFVLQDYGRISFVLNKN